MTNSFVKGLLAEAFEAVDDAVDWLNDGVTEETLAAIEDAEAALARAKRAIEDGIVPEENLD